MIKTCLKCNEEKHISLFMKSSASKTGYRNECKACHQVYFQRMKVNNPVKYKESYTKGNRSVGHISWDEYSKNRTENALGPQVVNRRRNHARRLKTNIKSMSELDKFVFDEAAKLCVLREKCTGVKWHIDHIIPLKYKHACGLHVATNFQVVPAKWNFKKSNKNTDTYFTQSR